MEAPLQVGGVVIDHRFDLLQDHVKPEADRNVHHEGTLEAARDNNNRLILAGAKIPVVFQRCAVGFEQSRVAVLQHRLAIKDKAKLH